MPPYPGPGYANLHHTNRQTFLFNNEAIPAGTASIAVQLERISRSSYPWGAAFQLKFSGPPGVFEVDIQVSETENDPDYITVAAIAATSTTNVARFDLTNIFPKFVRGYVRTLTNAVNTTLLVTR